MQFELSPEELNYHQAFTTLYGELRIWQLSDTPIYEPTDTRKTWLLNYVTGQTKYPARVHALLAMTNTYLNNPDVYIPDLSAAPAALNTINTFSGENSSDIKLFPNPANEIFHLHRKNHEGLAVIKIFDIHGKLITEQVWNDKNPITIKTNDWATGMYLVTIASSHPSNTITKKIFIIR